MLPKSPILENLTFSLELQNGVRPEDPVVEFFLCAIFSLHKEVKQINSYITLSACPFHSIDFKLKTRFAGKLFPTSTAATFLSAIVCLN